MKKIMIVVSCLMVLLIPIFVGIKFYAIQKEQNKIKKEQE